MMKPEGLLWAQRRSNLRGPSELLPTMPQLPWTGIRGSKRNLTKEGEQGMVIRDVKHYGETQEALALLKILALGNCQIEEGKVQPADDVLARLRKRASSRCKRQG